MNTSSTIRARNVLVLLFLHAFLGSPSAVAQYFTKSYAIVIGTDHIPNSRWRNLTYAEADARAVGDLLTSQGYDVIPLYGPKATKTNIGTEVLKLARILGPNDRVLIYFAGHGHSERLGKKVFGYLVPYDGGDNSAAYISMDEITTFSEQMSAAKHQLFIIDACFSGLAITRGGGVDPTIPDYIPENAKRRARQIIAAGGTEQEVLDSGSDGHSVFTHALLEGLSQGAADKREDGYILVPDLMSYLVARASNKYQTPATGNLPGHGLGEFMFDSPKPAVRRVPSAPSAETVRRGDTTPPSPWWKDPATGLIWATYHTKNELDWKDANSYCTSLRLGDRSWRLPTISELEGICGPAKVRKFLVTCHFNGGISRDTLPATVWSSIGPSGVPKSGDPDGSEAFDFDGSYDPGLSDLIFKKGFSHAGTPDSRFSALCVSDFDPTSLIP